MMFAFHWSFGGCRLLVRGLICLVAPVSRTKVPCTTAHATGLKSHSPYRGPEEQCGQETHPCANFSSRSDRNVDYPSHCRSVQNTANSQRLQPAPSNRIDSDEKCSRDERVKWLQSASWPTRRSQDKVHRYNHLVAGTRRKNEDHVLSKSFGM